MKFSFFFGDSPGRAVGDTGAAGAAVVVYALVGPFAVRKRSGGDDAEVTAGDALAGDEPFGKAEGPKAGGIGGMTFRPIACIIILFSFVIY